ncbi:MAG: hypothetical protein NKF70_10215 [Methanobacterium sp. ERen5]|nr:MAG: hypothetical protein NKF70_10215 [Methanobacterium sp. ERen5]
MYIFVMGYSILKKNFYKKLKKKTIIILFIIITAAFIIFYGINYGYVDVIVYGTHKGFLTLFEVISILLTFGSLLVIYLTLNELKIQRESMYKPDIVLKRSGRFYMYNEQNGHFAYLPSLWLNEEIVKNEIINQNKLLDDTENFKIPENLYNKFCNDPRRNIIPIPILNIGKGAAKNIEIIWKFDQESYIKEIKDKNDKTKMWNNFKFFGQFIPPNEIVHNQSKIDYITPVNTEITKNNLEYVYIPYDFQTLFEMDTTLNIYDGGVSSDELNHSLKLHVTYDDLTNKRHEKRFKFVFNSRYGTFNLNSTKIQKHIIYRLEMDFKIEEIQN